MNQTLWMVALFVLFDFVVVAVIVRSVVGAYWAPIPREYPAVPARAGAVRTEFCSAGAGLLSLGLSLHVEVDEEHLHLHPALLARMIGVRSASVPWSAVRVLGATPRRAVRLKIAGCELTGKWRGFEACVERGVRGA